MRSLQNSPTIMFCVGKAYMPSTLEMMDYAKFQHILANLFSPILGEPLDKADLW